MTFRFAHVHSRGPNMHYVAIDLHKSESYVVVIDEDGSVVEEAKVANDELDHLTREYAGSEAVIEATSNYFTVYDRLSEHLEVQVANPLQMAWVTEGQKSDRADAKQLAEVLRLGGIQESYVPPQEIRERRALVRARKKFVEQRTKYKNEVRSLLDQAGITPPSGLFSEAGRSFLEDLDLSDPAGFLLENWLELIDELNAKLDRFDQRIQQAAAPVKAVEYAVSAPGVALYSGLMVHAELGEIDRFDRAAEAVSYAGLDPVVRESGETRREAGISKQGNGYLRWILYQCASAAVHNTKDPYLKEFYDRLRYHRGKSHKKAMVATSRKLLVSLFHMMRNEEVYNPAGTG